MRIALCLYGKTGSLHGKTLFNSSDNLDPSIAHYFFHNNVIKKYKTDTFVHSWSTSKKNEIIKLYKPVNFIIERQKLFFPFKSLFKEFCNIKKFNQKIIWLYNLFFKYNYGIDRRFKRAQATYSRFYSAYKAIELKKNFEKLNGFQYDYVISARLDLCIFKSINFKKFKKNILYCPHTVKFKNKLSKEYSDVEILHNKIDQLNDEIFISDSQTINKFSKIYFDLPNLRLSNHFSPYDFVIRNKIKYNKFCCINFDHSISRVIVGNNLNISLNKLLK